MNASEDASQTEVSSLIVSQEDSSPSASPSMLPTWVDRNLYNSIVVGAAFFMVFFSFNTVQGFVTTLGKEIGFLSLMVLYLFFAATNLIAPKVIELIGLRFGMIVGSACYVVFIAANAYPAWYTLIPAAAVNGVGASILWSSQGTFLARSSEEKNLGLFSGIFFAIFMSNQVAGNIVAGSLLLIDTPFLVIFLAFSVIAAIGCMIFGALYKPPSVKSEVGTEWTTSLYATIRHFKDPKMLLIIPLMMYSGQSQEFFYGSLPPRVAEWRHAGIAFCMVALGVFDTISSVLFGKLSDKIGKLPVLCVLVLCANVGVLSSLLASPARPYLYFISFSSLGIADGAVNTQLYALLGKHFVGLSSLEGAYALFRLVQALSTAAAYIYAPYVPFWLLCGLLSCFSIIGVVCSSIVVLKWERE